MPGLPGEYLTGQKTGGQPLGGLSLSDIRGIAKLATEASIGVTRIAEGVHQSVWQSVGFSGGADPGQARGLTGLVYKSIYRVTRIAGRGADAVLGGLQNRFEAEPTAVPTSPTRESILAALNGVMGDRLSADNNPFAIAMGLRYRGWPLDWNAPPPMAEVTGKVLVLVHGLCMNELGWQRKDPAQGEDYGAELASRLGYTPVYLRYNSGLHIALNGEAFSRQLEHLTESWPVPIEDLTVVAHSMGGLVTRSAIHQAQQAGLAWVTRLRNLVFLGTPHHGAPLERVGNWVDVILGSTPYTAPFARIGHLRSAGITDLRYGDLTEADWHGHERFQDRPDQRIPVPLPDGVDCYAVAATTASRSGGLAGRLMGDGLVPVDSAFGRHQDPRRTLAFADAAKWVAYRTSHMSLLNSPEVSGQMLRWLG